MSANISRDMFKQRSQHGDIRVGDLTIWPGYDLGISLGGPFRVARINDDNFYIARADGGPLPDALGHRTQDGLYELSKSDGYLLWHRPRPKVTLLIKSHD